MYIMEGVFIMRFIISGRNIEVTQALKSAILEKLGKLDKYFTSENEAHVTLTVEKLRHIIEVTIPVKGGIIRAEEEAENMYIAIDLVIDVLERQLLKHKTKLVNRHRQHGTFKQEFLQYEREHQDLDEIKIVRSKKFAVKPMDAEDACIEMDLLGHDFYVFRNRDTEEINVVYKRKGGAYGLIEPEF